MTYKGNVFGRSFGRERSRAGEGALSVIVRAVVFAALTLAVCLLLPQGMGPAFWQESLFGCAHVYVLVSCVLTMLLRVFNSRIFSYGDRRKGRWDLAASCGASVKTSAAAKYLAALYTGAAAYVLGAAVALGVRFLLGAGAAQVGDVFQLLAVGLLTVLVHSCSLAVFGALGMRSKGLAAVSLLPSAVLLLAWLLSGMFAFTAAGEKVYAAVLRLLALPLGLLPAAALLLVLSAVLCLTLPVRRASRFGVEELDDAMLQQLDFSRELEVYQKDGDEYELVFSGEDVAQ